MAEIFLKIDTEKHSEEQMHNIITKLFNKTSQKEQQELPSQRNDETVSIVVRDGDNKKTIDVKEDLKRLGFNYYAKTKAGKDDPRWTMTCNKDYWNEIKDHSVLDDLNVWTSEGGNN